MQQQTTEQKKKFRLKSKESKLCLHPFYSHIEHVAPVRG